MTKKIYLLGVVLSLATVNLFAQVKIGSTPGTINANSLLELESTTKGFLMPRVTLTNVSSYSPMASSPTAGMLVYNSGSTLSEGFYYWSGSVWKKIESENSSLVTKTANATLTLNETLVMVAPSGTSATITLPNISSADEGHTVTIKNIGDADDLVTIADAGDDPIDGDASVTLTRWMGQTFIASNSNWIVKDKINIDDHFLEVNPNSSWTTIDEVVDFLDAHMDGPTVVRLGDDEYELSATVVINLDYPLTFQGISYGTASIVPHATNMLGKTMFRCYSDCYFKMLDFTYNGVAAYGDGAREDAIHFLGAGTYNEIKDCTFEGFYNTIIDSTSAELWVFEVDITDANRNGILLHSGVSGATLKVAETDFIGCSRGINMDKGTSVTVQLASGGYYNGSSTDSAIVYKATTFTSFTSISITGNSWNNTGVYVTGFDFTRSDGRDANAILESNAGMGDRKPNCYINLLNGSTTTTLTSSSSWYKLSWTNTSSTTCKFTIANNKVTYQPTNRRDALVILTGNLSVNNSSRTISLGLVKNNSSGTRYGETTLRTGSSNLPNQFATVVYLSDLTNGDYFEVFCSSANSGDVITTLDVNWQVITF